MSVRLFVSANLSYREYVHIYMYSGYFFINLHAEDGVGTDASDVAGNSYFFINFLQTYIDLLTLFHKDVQ